MSEWTRIEECPRAQVAADFVAWFLADRLYGVLSCNTDFILYGNVLPDGPDTTPLMAKLGEALDRIAVESDYEVEFGWSSDRAAWAFVIPDCEANSESALWHLLFKCADVLGLEP
jgi:hypothetical protein